MDNKKLSKKVQEKSSTTNNQQIQAKLLGTNVNEINIEQMRQVRSNTNYNLSGKLTQQNIKSMSNKFSMDVVFALDLSNQKLTSIDSLSQCTNIILLNISNNSLTDLSPLKNMKTLSFLNVSFNQLTSLELIDLVQLQNLQAQGNNIKAFQNIESLIYLQSLKTLYLQALTGQAKNPICDQNGYRKAIFTTLKQLVRLDGYGKDQQLSNGTELKKTEPQIKMELPNIGPWYVQQFPKVEQSQIQIQEDSKIKQNLDESRKLINNIEMKLSLLK